MPPKKNKHKDSYTTTNVLAISLKTLQNKITGIPNQNPKLHTKHVLCSILEIQTKPQSLIFSLKPKPSRNFPFFTFFFSHGVQLCYRSMYVIHDKYGGQKRNLKIMFPKRNSKGVPSMKALVEIDSVLSADDLLFSCLFHHCCWF